MKATGVPEFREVAWRACKACAVSADKYTSNATLRYFLGSPMNLTDSAFTEWFKKLHDNSLGCIYANIKIAYQSKEGDYHARSFEDAFINLNLSEIKAKFDEGKLWGLKCTAELRNNTAVYDLTNKIIDKKSDFAASLLFLALSEDTEWKTPLYIKEGLAWIAEE